LSRDGKPENGEKRQDICTCLKGFRDCEVWSKIFNVLRQETGLDFQAKPFSFRITLLRGQAYRRGAPKYLTIFHSIYQRALIKTEMTSIERLLRRAEADTIRRNWQLIDAIGKACNMKVVIDSSKDIVRFHMLWSRRPEDTHLIVLVRDVYRIAASAIKRKADPLRSARAWGGYYQLILKLVESNPKIPMILINYEDMCENPETTRRQIAQHFDLSESTLMANIDTRNYHIVFGSESRYAGPISIIRDDIWKMLLSDNALCKQLDKIRDQIAPDLRKLRDRSDSNFSG